MHCFMRPLCSCDIKTSVVSQCRILVAVQYKQLFAVFLTEIAPAGLLTVDTD